MPLRRSRRQLTPASGRSLTPHPGRQDRVLGPAPADLALVGQGERVGLMALVAAVVLVLRHLVGRAVPAELDLARLVAAVVLVPPVAMAPVVRAVLADRVQTVRAVLADRVQTVRADLADPAQTGRAAPADLVGLMSLVDRAAPAAPAVPNLTGRVDLAGRAAPVDRHRRRTSNTVSTTAVAHRWAAPGTCRTGSARRITGRRLRPGNTDSAGTVGLPPVLRRLSGTDHHLQVAGVGLRLPVDGTAHGTGRRAMSQSRSVISGRLVTTATTRSRCSTRCSVDGASGSSVSGSRCTDLTASTPD